MSEEAKKSTVSKKSISDWWKEDYYYYPAAGGYSIPASEPRKKYAWEGGIKSLDNDYDDEGDYWDDYTGCYKPKKKVETAFGRPIYRSSLGWDKDRLATSSYTTYISNYNSVKTSDTFSESEKVLTCAYKSVRDIIVILNFPFPVDIKITNSEIGKYRFDMDSGLERSKARIVIPTKVLDDSSYKETEKISIFCGLGIHEAAHLKFTKIKVLECLHSMIYAKFPSINPVKVEFINCLINIIEDERVEDSLLRERPGYTEFIEKEKLYTYSIFIKSSKTGSSKINRYIDNLFRIIRYPDKIDMVSLEEFSDSYTRIKDIIFPLPESTKESCIAGLNVFNEMLNYFKEIEIDDRKLSDKEIDKAFSEFSDLLRDSIFNTVLYGEDGDNGCCLASRLLSNDVKSSGKLFESIFSGVFEKGEGSGVYFKKTKGDKTSYLNRAAKIRKYIPGIKKLINGVDKNFEFNVYGCRSGLLDTNKLAEAYQGVPQVYIRKGVVKTNKVAVCVLIDESGSMSSNGKEDVARDAAILLNEALGNLPGVELFIYGHTADKSETGGSGTTMIRKYREGKFYCSKYGLTESFGDWENRDGVAIYETAKRVRSLTDSKVLMFILSDGEPCAYEYHGRSAMNHVRSKVKEVEKMNFDVVQICIDYVYDATSMFDNVIDLKNDVSNLPKELSKIIKNSIVNNKVTEIS